MVVDTAKIVGPALDARWNRENHSRVGRKNIITGWNIEPWCISRQLWWGHQVPVWFDEEGNQYCRNRGRGTGPSA